MLVLVCGLSIAACRSKKPEPSPASSAPKPPASAPLVVSSAEVPEPEPPELPTESDYEQEVSEGITGANLESELDQLEKELLGR
jgi:hypothetical protein